MSQSSPKSPRRKVLASALAASLALATPRLSFAQTKIVRLVSVWGRAFPLVGPSAQRLAERLTAVTDGALRVELFAAGELGSPGEAHARVGAGEAEIYHGVEYFWAAKNPAFHLFAGVPFGLTDVELAGWLQGPGSLHWNNVQAPFNIKPFLAGILSGSLGFWSGKAIETADDFDGLTVRASGLTRTLLRDLGADARPVPFSRLAPALEVGAVDAAEWFGPWADPSMALSNAASFIYGPPVLRPAMAISAGANLPFWFGLTESQRAGFKAVFAAETQQLLLETRRQNALNFQQLVESDNTTKIREFSPELLTFMGRRAGNVLAEKMASDQTDPAILTDFLNYRSSSYSEVLFGASGFMKSRELPFTFAR